MRDGPIQEPTRRGRACGDRRPALCWRRTSVRMAAVSRRP